MTSVRSDEEKHSSSGLEFKLHPLVLINVSDHVTRVKANSAQGTPLIVLGCLLGSQSGRTVDVSNSFEFSHTLTPDGTFVINEALLNTKREQYKTVFPKLDVVGWYATGTGITQGHMQVHTKIMELNESPAFLLMNPSIDSARRDLPISMYETELHVLDGVPSTIFVKANYVIETSDAERIGVDQVAKILPSGKASGPEQLTAHLTALHSAIKMLVNKLQVLQQVISTVAAGEVPYPHALMRGVNSLMSSLPALDNGAFQKDAMTENNDTLAALYLASLTKSLAELNDYVDRFNVAYEKNVRRGAGGGGQGMRGMGMGIMA